MPLVSAAFLFEQRQEYRRLNKRKIFFCEKIRNQGLHIDKYIQGGIIFNKSLSAVRDTK